MLLSWKEVCIQVFIASQSFWSAYQSGVIDLLVESLKSNSVWHHQRGARLRSPPPPAPYCYLSSACSFHGERKWEGALQKIGPGKTSEYRSAPTPALPSGGKSVRRSMVDQYSTDNLTSAFNSTCPHLCVVSWLLIKRIPPGPNLQLKDSVATGTTDSSTCKTSNWSVMSSRTPQLCNFSALCPSLFFKQLK